MVCHSGCQGETRAATVAAGQTDRLYLLAVVEEEQGGIPPYAVVRAHLVVLCTVHLCHHNRNICC